MSVSALNVTLSVTCPVDTCYSSPIDTHYSSPIRYTSVAVSIHMVYWIQYISLFKSNNIYKHLLFYLLLFKHFRTRHFLFHYFVFAKTQDVRSCQGHTNNKTYSRYGRCGRWSYHKVELISSVLADCNGYMPEW